MPGFGRLEQPKKRLVIAAGAIVFVILSWVVLSRFSASFEDRSESFYATLEEADKEGAVTRGWVPDNFLPNSSRAIHLVYTLSPSSEWCAFEFDPSDTQKLHN